MEQFVLMQLASLVDSKITNIPESDRRAHLRLLSEFLTSTNESTGFSTKDVWTHEQIALFLWLQKHWINKGYFGETEENEINNEAQGVSRLSRLEVQKGKESEGVVERYIRLLIHIPSSRNREEVEGEIVSVLTLFTQAYESLNFMKKGTSSSQEIRSPLQQLSDLHKSESSSAQGELAWCRCEDVFQKDEGVDRSVTSCLMMTGSIDKLSHSSLSHLCTFLGFLIEEKEISQDEKDRQLDSIWKYCSSCMFRFRRTQSTEAKIPLVSLIRNKDKKKRVSTWGLSSVRYQNLLISGSSVMRLTQEIQALRKEVEKQNNQTLQLLEQHTNTNQEDVEFLLNQNQARLAEAMRWAQAVDEQKNSSSISTTTTQAKKKRQHQSDDENEKGKKGKVVKQKSVSPRPLLSLEPSVRLAMGLLFILSVPGWEQLLQTEASIAISEFVKDEKKNKT